MKNPSISVLLALSLISAHAGAATITWSVASISGDTDVVSTGVTHTALNGSATAVTNPLTINGVEFQSDGDGSDLLSGNFGGDAWTGPETGDYQQLLSNIDFQSNGTGDLTVTTFSGLAIGDNYTFQYWYADDNWQAPNPDRELTISLGTGTQSGDNVINGGEFATGTFTADATSIDLIVSSTHNGVRMSALQLRNTSIPEPSIALLSGLGVLGLIRRRRD
ncbi:PEP-CTERM sorting domain-containing protein [Haloferula chungangensis]|uniref:PEP-CTERM sorting domain-containing protein n=1 Tax=Haloferula chungangensis TaxID=1048331 RepID=A0ABW2L603_9BACT